MAYQLKTRQNDVSRFDYAEIGPPGDTGILERVAKRVAPDTACLALGRLLFGGFFLYSGIDHFQSRDMMVDYASSKGVPQPDAAVAGSGALILLGGLSLLLGMKPKIGASLIATFLIGVTPKMHDFWNIEDPQQRTVEMVNFGKNLALLGGSLLAMAIPEPWPLRVDADAA